LFLRFAVRKVALGRIDNFAGIAVFLASPASDFVTGAAIPVDGGYSIMA
jgi:2-deoxy-D-gluconate 3-dehydrogenase